MKSQEKDFILYLDTRSFPLEREEELRAAKNAGLNLVIATPSVAPYKNYEIKHIIEAPLGHFSSAEEIILNYVRSHHLNVKGVVAWGDISVELAARLGSALGLPSTTPQAAENVRNKVRTRKLLAQLDSINPRHAVIRDYSSFKENFATIGVPCLIKPAGASFGRGIFRINSFEQAATTFRNFVTYCTPTRDEIYSHYPDEFLLEEYLDGTEHSVAGLVADGQVYILAIADKKIDIEIPFQYENIIPSRLAVEIQKQIIEFAESAVELMGINWCGFHIDLMVTEDGPKILEIGGRLGGECINSHLIPLSSPQLSPYALLLQVVQGNNPFIKNNLINEAVKQAGIRALLPTKPGRIVGIEGLEKVKNHPNTRAFVQTKNIGDQVFLPVDKLNEYVVGYVIAQGGCEENLAETLEEMANLVSIKID